MKAKANLSALIPKYRSKTEELWAQEGEWIVKDELEVQVLTTYYEPMSFSLEGGRYKPDFLHILDTAELAFIEVKGSKKQRGYAASRAKLRAAAERYPFFNWYMALRIKGRGNEGWELERID